MPTHYVGTKEECRALDVFIKLLRAAESVAARASCSIDEAGLTTAQFGVLEVLLHRGPLLLHEIAEKQLRSPNNISVVVANLERLGLVRRERDAQDRRGIRVHLTEEGKERIAGAFPGHVRALVDQMRVLTDEELDLLQTLLRRLGKQEETMAPKKGG